MIFAVGADGASIGAFLAPAAAENAETLVFREQGASVELQVTMPTEGLLELGRFLVAHCTGTPTVEIARIIPADAGHAHNPKGPIARLGEFSGYDVEH